MTNKNELNNEELNKVSGGRCQEDGRIFLLGDKLDQYETANHIGDEVAVLTPSHNSPSCLVFGTLMKSYEDTYNCGTRRCVEVKPHYRCKPDADMTSEGFAKCYVDSNKVYLVDGYLV